MRKKAKVIIAVDERNVLMNSHRLTNCF